MSELAPATRIENAILLLRGQKVLLDADLAELYGVETKALVRAVKRNAERFPTDFMFQLTPEEVARLRCQIGTSKQFRAVFEAIRELATPPEAPPKKIEFHVREPRVTYRVRGRR